MSALAYEPLVKRRHCQPRGASYELINLSNTPLSSFVLFRECIFQQRWLPLLTLRVQRVCSCWAHYDEWRWGRKLVEIDAAGLQRHSLMMFPDWGFWSCEIKCGGCFQSLQTAVTLFLHVKHVISSGKVERYGRYQELIGLSRSEV